MKKKKLKEELDKLQDVNASEVAAEMKKIRP